MSLQALASVAPPPSPAPVMRTDMRPTADTAALVRDPQPEIPLPIPASTTQKSTVTQAQISAPPIDTSAIQRVLKPYGVVMLPQGAAQQTAGKDPDPGRSAGPDAAPALHPATAPALHPATAPAPETADTTASETAAEEDAHAPEKDGPHS